MHGGVVPVPTHRVLEHEAHRQRRLRKLDLEEVEQTLSRLIQGSECGVESLEFRVEGSGWRVWGVGLRGQGCGFRVWGLGFGVQDSGCRI